MCLRHGQKSFEQIVRESTCQRLQRVQHRRYDDDFTAFPSCIGVAGANPFAALELGVFRDLWLLFRRTRSEKKPGVKTAWRKRGRDPSAGKSEIARIQV